MSSRVIVIGSTNVDLVSTMDSIPNPGETISGKGFVIHHGGKGANQALMAARAGASVSIITAVGEDDFGQSAIANLAANGVDVSSVTVFPGSTGVASIWVDRNGENRIVLNPGANHKLDAKLVLEKLESIGEFKILVAQLEIPIEVVIAAFRSGKSRGAITILNPAPFQELPGELLELTDWLIVNEHEFAGLHPSSLLPESDQVIGEIDIANLVVTLGAAGAVLSDGSITRITAPRSEAIDTTGAGDCLVGSFAAGLGLGLVASKALEFGVFCASESVASPGAQSSYPSRERSAEIFKSLNQDLL